MFNDDKGRRDIALSITLYAYRNTKLEGYHVEKAVMDKEFYRAIYNVVRDKLNNVKLLQRYLDAFPDCDLNDKQNFDRLMESVPEQLHFKFLIYSKNIVGAWILASHWDDAVRAEPIRAGQSCANYVLAGKFSECCKSGCKLTDAVMCEINKDVHNRIYTLLTDGYFNR